MLEVAKVARECIKDPGETGWKRRPIGCYIGRYEEDWVKFSAKDNQQYGLYRVTGYGDFMLPNRMLHEMDLMKPRSVR